MQDKNVSIDAIVQDDKVQSLISEIAALPPEVQIAIGVDESNVGNAEAIKAQIESNPASITVDYVKGKEPEKADDIQGKANYSLGEHPTKLQTFQVQLIIVLVVILKLLQLFLVLLFILKRFKLLAQ